MLIEPDIKAAIERALAEDLGGGDITTEALIPSEQRGTASIVAKQKGILAGIHIAEEVFHSVDPQLTMNIIIEDGASVGRGSTVARIDGRVASILHAERVALNFLQSLSGIASATGRYVEAVKGLPVSIMDTRKTAPGLRSLEKYAVRVAGGKNHRMNLSEALLIKDNHLAALRSLGLSLPQIVAKAKQASKGLKVEVEVQTQQEAEEAAKAGADIIMLDNMSLQEMRQAVKAVDGRALIEASGGITLDRIRAIAETGVDFISVGAITHSAEALDISLELEPSDKYR